MKLLPNENDNFISFRRKEIQGDIATDCSNEYSVLLVFSKIAAPVLFRQLKTDDSVSEAFKHSFNGVCVLAAAALVLHTRRGFKAHLV